MILIDSSVLLDLVEAHPQWSEWSEAALVRAASEDTLLINVIVYAEISRSFTSALSFASRSA